MIAAWKLPPMIAAIAVSIVGGFYLGGPGLGMAVGALAAAAILVFAARNPPRGPIRPAPLPDLRPHLLVVVSAPLEDREALARIAELGHVGDPGWAEPEVVVLAPAPRRFLDRWSGERGPAEQAANRGLVVTLASLAGAGVAASARIGEEDVVQAVEDELRLFPATDVILVSADPADDEASAELAERLQCGYRRLSPARPETCGAGRRGAPALSLAERQPDDPDRDDPDRHDPAG